MALISALSEACAFCDRAENRDRLAATLARPGWVGAPDDTLHRSLQGPFHFGNGQVRVVDDFIVFHRGDANAPTPEKAAWILAGFRATSAPFKPGSLNSALIQNVFRLDLYNEALRLNTSAPNHEFESHFTT